MSAAFVAVSPQRNRDIQNDTDMMMAQQCRPNMRHSPPHSQSLKRSFEAALISSNQNQAGPGMTSPFEKRIRLNEQSQGFAGRTHDFNRGNEENMERRQARSFDHEDDSMRHRKSHDRIGRLRDAARPSTFGQAESTALKTASDAEIADKYIPLKKRRMHEHRMDGVVMTSVKEKPQKEVTFTFAQVRSILAKALKEKEVDLRLEFEAILQEKLMEQYHQFIKFNEDYVSRTRPTDDSSSWFYVS